MFFFRKRAAEPPVTSFLSFLETDMHSHLVPGIDDGVKEPMQGVQFISQLQQWGIRKIITTPHIMMDRYPNSAQTIEKPYHTLRDALHENGVEIEMRYAAEYYLDENFETLLENPLLTLSGHYVLIEFSFMQAPLLLQQWLFDLQTRGYQPVMAHPERYSYFHAQPEVFREFKSRGCMLQVNLLSLTGYYGRSVQQTAEWLLAQGLADFTGTDLHHEKHLASLGTIANNKKLLKQLEQYPFRNKEL